MGGVTKALFQTAGESVFSSCKEHAGTLSVIRRSVAHVFPSERVEGKVLTWMLVMQQSDVTRLL